MEKQVKEAVKEVYVFGNISDQDIVFPDLIVGPNNTGPAFKILPGEVVDLEEFFTVQRLKRARYISIAKEKGYIRACESGEKIAVNKRIMSSGLAPLNEFDLTLAEELDKEEVEMQKMKAGSVDTLGARARAELARQRQNV